MGEVFFIITERITWGTNIFSFGEALTRCRPVGAKERPGQAPMYHLSALAREAAVRPLVEFFVEDPESAGWRATSEGGAEPTGGLPLSQWFTAAEGLESVRGLIDYLTTHTESAAEVKGVIGDLRQLEKLFDRLDHEGIPWHLEDGSWW